MEKQEMLADLLPHGAGIDSDWTIEETPVGYECFNSYHAANESGYIGWVDFSVSYDEDLVFIEVELNEQDAQDVWIDQIWWNEELEIEQMTDQSMVDWEV